MVTPKELTREGFEMRTSGMSLEGISKFIHLENNAKEIRIYQETELEGGINPEKYYLFVRKD